MLTWMQHHKKYLIVTVWVSAIAFIGASAVGWGAYDYNQNRSGSVALVDDEKISFSEFNTRYNNIYNYYNQISNGNLNEESAKALGLDVLALNSLIEDKLLLRFAKDLGLNFSEEEVVQELAKESAFQNDSGVFDKNIYYKLLEQNKILPKDYEQILGDQIIHKKLEAVFKIPSREEELKMLASSYYMRDFLSIARLDYNAKNIAIDEDRLKKFWEGHKDDFKTQKIYELSTYLVKVDGGDYKEEELRAFYEDGDNQFKYKDFSGKILSFEDAKTDVARDYALDKFKGIANERFIALRNKKINFEKELNVTENDILYPIEFLAKAKEGDVLKPVVWKEGYLIVRLDKTNPARTKSFEEAREEVLPLYLSEESRKNLEAKARENLENFKGIDIGFVNRNSKKDAKKIEDTMLNNAEFSYFVNSVFNSDQNSSYVILDDKRAVLYRIKKQKLDLSAKDFNETRADMERNLQALKANEIKQELLKTLRKNYQVEIYYKGN